MLGDGTILVSNPHQVTRVAPSDSMYAAWLAHLGGLKPGEQKDAASWPDPFDAARVERSVRDYLLRKGVVLHGCNGDIMGTDHDGNVTAWVVCQGVRLRVRISHDDYAVTEVHDP